MSALRRQSSRERDKERYIVLDTFLYQLNVCKVSLQFNIYYKSKNYSFEGHEDMIS